MSRCAGGGTTGPGTVSTRSSGYPAAARARVVPRRRRRGSTGAARRRGITSAIAGLPAERAPQEPRPERARAAPFGLERGDGRVLLLGHANREDEAPTASSRLLPDRCHASQSITGDRPWKGATLSRVTAEYELLRGEPLEDVAGPVTRPLLFAILQEEDRLAEQLLRAFPTPKLIAVRIAVEPDYSAFHIDAEPFDWMLDPKERRAYEERARECRPAALHFHCRWLVPRSPAR
jgi:hypothetical protein